MTRALQLSPIDGQKALRQIDEDDTGSSAIELLKKVALDGLFHLLEASELVKKIGIRSCRSRV